MSEMTSFDAAAEALAAANRGDATPEPSQSSEQAPAAAPEVDAGTTSTEDSFANIDPNLLPPELQAQYKNMQGAFTRRMQELSAREKQYEDFGSPEEVEQAVQLMRVLQEDPLYVHQQLSSFLQSNGMSVAQADAAAQQVMQQQAQQQNVDEWVDPEEAQAQALQEKLSRVEQWIAYQEAAARENLAMNEIQREEMKIRQDNPSFTQEDIDAVYQLAFAHGGSLLRAEQAYKSLQDQWAAGYVQQKASVPAGVSSPSPTGGAQQPSSFTDLNDPALEAAAQAALQAALGES